MSNGTEPPAKWRSIFTVAGQFVSCQPWSHVLYQLETLVSSRTLFWLFNEVNKAGELCRTWHCGQYSQTSLCSRGQMDHWIWLIKFYAGGSLMLRLELLDACFFKVLIRKLLVWLYPSMPGVSNHKAQRGQNRSLQKLHEFDVPDDQCM